MQKKTNAKRARGPRNDNGRSTRERILDAAERLFAAQGFHAVSVRDITAAAGVDVALVNYHFGGKLALFEDVFMRRAEVLNAERLRRLELLVARAAPKPPGIEAIIDAFTHPLLDRSARGGPGWKAYFALIAQVNNSTEFGGLMMTRYFDPVVHAFIAALRSTMPECDERDIFWSYHFLSGALTLTFAETGRIDNLPKDCVVRRIWTACTNGSCLTSLPDFARCAYAARLPSAANVAPKRELLQTGSSTVRT